MAFEIAGYKIEGRNPENPVFSMPFIRLLLNAYSSEELWSASEIDGAADFLIDEINRSRRNSKRKLKKVKEEDSTY